MRNAMQQYGVATSLAIDAILVTYLNDWQMLFIIHLSESKYQVGIDIVSTDYFNSVSICSSFQRIFGRYLCSFVFAFQQFHKLKQK